MAATVHPPDQPPRPTRWRPVRRVLRVVGFGIVGLVVVLLLVLGLAPTRGWLLRTGLGIADGSLPGELSWRRAAWPAPGRVEIDHLLWTTADDTLATVTLARLQLQILPLLKGEVVVDSLRVGGGWIDLAGVQAVMPDTAAAPADTTRQRSLPRVVLRSVVVRDVTVLTPAGAALRLAGLDAALELRPDHDRGGNLAARVELGRDLAAAWRVTGRWDDGLEAQFSSLPLVHGEAAPAADSLPLSGRLHLSREALVALRDGGRWPRLDLEGFTVTGPLLAASLDAQLAGADSGRVDLKLTLAKPPAALAADLASFAPDSLRDRVTWLLTDGWPAKDPRLELHAKILPPADGRTIAAAGVMGTASFVLPGPADLGALQPDTLQTDDLGAIAGRLAGVYDGHVQPPSYRVDLDLRETAWLSAGRVRAHGRGRAVTVEECELVMRGLSLSATGTYDSTAVDLVAEIVVPDLSLVRRWPGAVPASAEGQARAKVAVHGTLPLPDAELDLQASYRSPQASVSSLTLLGTHTNRRLRLALELPGGIVMGRRQIDAMSLAIAGDLAGYPDSGTVDVRLSAAMDTSSVALVATTTVARRGSGLPAVAARIDTLGLTHGRRTLTLADPCSLSLDPVDSSLTIRGLQLDGEFGHLVADAWVRRDSLDVTLDVDLAVPLEEVRPFLPTKQQVVLPTGTVALVGELRLQGSPAAPFGQAHFTTTLRDVPRRPSVSLSGDLWLRNAGVVVAGAPADAPASGVAADLALALADAPVLAVTARLPATIVLQPPSFMVLDEAARVVVRGDAIDLRQFAALLPPEMSLEGRLGVNLTASGAAQDMALAGEVSAWDVRVDLADDSWFAAEGKVAATGRLRAPDLEGAITLKEGLLIIPETPPDLLPAEGNSLLWTGDVGADSLAVEADSMAVARAAAADSVAVAAAGTAALRLVSPGNMWLRGRGLDMELKGDVWVRIAGTSTMVSGEFNAVRGTLSLLGRTFTLEHGQVLLHDEVREMQPQLDISLVTELEGEQYRVAVTGTPVNMELELTSDSGISEGDIMAILIFGKPLDELDSGQADLVAQRSSEIAAAYGAGRLQAIIADELGLDLVRIEPHTEDASATTLTVGKYLSPKVMVSYEQTLESVSTFIVHLEYLLKGGFKVHSAVSPGDASGAELLWSKDF